MKKKLLTTGAALFACSFSAQATVLAAYDFNANNATITISAANLATSGLFAASSIGADTTASNITVGTGLTGATFVTGGADDFIQVAEGQGLSDGVHADGGDISGFINDAFTAGDFLEFTLTASAANEFNLTSLTFDYRGGTNGPDDYGIRTSVDGFGSNVVVADDAASGIQTIDLSGADFQGVSGITFRIAVDDRANNSNGSSAAIFDDITVNGVVVPEPSSAALLGLGGLALLARRKRA